MKDQDFIKEIQEKMYDGYKITDFINHNKTLVISIEESKACIEFEKIREMINEQLSNLDFLLHCELTGQKKEYKLGNILKATLNGKNSLDLSYNLKRTNK